MRKADTTKLYNGYNKTVHVMYTTNLGVSVIVHVHLNIDPKSHMSQIVTQLLSHHST